MKVNPSALGLYAILLTAALVVSPWFLAVAIVVWFLAEIVAELL